MVMRCLSVPVQNLTRAKAFYSALLKIDLERQPRSLKFERRSEPSMPLLRFDVTDRFDEAISFVWSNGGRIIELAATPNDKRNALVMDCEGNCIALYATR